MVKSKTSKTSKKKRNVLRKATSQKRRFSQKTTGEKVRVERAFKKGARASTGKGLSEKLYKAIQPQRKKPKGVTPVVYQVPEFAVGLNVRRSKSLPNAEPKIHDLKKIHQYKQPINIIGRVLTPPRRNLPLQFPNIGNYKRQSPQNVTRYSPKPYKKSPKRQTSTGESIPKKPSPTKPTSTVESPKKPSPTKPASTGDTGTKKPSPTKSADTGDTGPKDILALILQIYEKLNTPEQYSLTNLTEIYRDLEELNRYIPPEKEFAPNITNALKKLVIDIKSFSSVEQE